MPNKYCSIEFDKQQLLGQFILTSEKMDAPVGWTFHENGQWQL